MKLLHTTDIEKSLRQLSHMDKGTQAWTEKTFFISFCSTMDNYYYYCFHHYIFPFIIFGKYVTFPTMSTIPLQSHTSIRHWTNELQIHFPVQVKLHDIHKSGFRDPSLFFFFLFFFLHILVSPYNFYIPKISNHIPSYILQFTSQDLNFKLTCI